MLHDFNKINENELYLSVLNHMFMIDSNLFLTAEHAKYSSGKSLKITLKEGNKNT